MTITTIRAAVLLLLLLLFNLTSCCHSNTTVHVPSDFTVRFTLSGVNNNSSTNYIDVVFDGAVAPRGCARVWQLLQLKYYDANGILRIE
jgi:hypothetical protein